MKEDQDTLIVRVWNKVFSFLGVISLFYIVQLYCRRKKIKLSYTFVDMWVMSHTVLSLLAVIISYYSDSTFIRYIIFYYGMLRVFEVVIYQVKVILIDAYKADANVNSYRRSVICLIHNFVEIIFWFTASYVFLLDKFEILNPSGNLLQAFYISFVTMTTFGPPNFNIKGSPAMYLVLFESVIGLFFTLISLARFISILPKPKSLHEREKE
jgi:hypothetical protein